MGKPSAYERLLAILPERWRAVPDLLGNELNHIIQMTFAAQDEGVELRLQPVNRWRAIAYLDELEEAHKTGEESALLAAIGTCADAELLIPDWARLAFVARFRRVADAEAASWDEVFGRPHGERAKVSAIRERKRAAPVIYERVKAMTRGVQRVSVTTALKAVAAERGESMEKVRALYYEHKRRVETLIDLPLSKKTP